MSARSELDNSNQTPPEKAMIRMIQGAALTQMVHVAAELGIADLLKDGPKSSDVLAKSTGTNPDALYRLLRGLASVGVFSEIEDRHFELTPMAACLQTDAANSMHTFATWTGQAVYWQPWGSLLYSVKTGKPAFQHIFGMGIFEYFDKNGEAAALFNQYMNERITTLAKAISAACDFSGTGKIVDVGGGQGLLIATILKANPHLRGVLFEMASVIEGAKEIIEREGVAERCELVSGDFFESVSVVADVYILSSIIHDWDDSNAVTILRNCRHNMPAHGRLLLVESVIPPGNEPAFGKLTDLNMLVLAGGRERTEAEFRSLFDAAGFKLARIIPTQSAMSIIEAAPA